MKNQTELTELARNVMNKVEAEGQPNPNKCGHTLLQSTSGITREISTSIYEGNEFLRIRAQSSPKKMFYVEHNLGNNKIKYMAQDEDLSSVSLSPTSQRDYEKAQRRYEEHLEDILEIPKSEFERALI